MQQQIVKLFPSFRREATLTKQNVGELEQVAGGLIKQVGFTLKQYQKLQEQKHSQRISSDSHSLLECTEASDSLLKDSINKSEEVIKSLKTENDYLNKQTGLLRQQLEQRRETTPKSKTFQKMSLQLQQQILVSEKAQAEVQELTL